MKQLAKQREQYEVFKKLNLQMEKGLSGGEKTRAFITKGRYGGDFTVIMPNFRYT